jgi:hydrogenase maturation factor
MCVGRIATLAEVRGEGEAPTGVLDDGTVVSLAYCTGARPGDALLLHLGIPVEVLDQAEAARALDLRTTIARGGTG